MLEAKMEGTDGVKLYSHQQAALNYIRNNSNRGFPWDYGMGLSYITIGPFSQDYAQRIREEYRKRYPAIKDFATRVGIRVGIKFELMRHRIAKRRLQFYRSTGVPHSSPVFDYEA